MRLFTGILTFMVGLLCAGTAFSQTAVGANVFYHLPSGTMGDYFGPAPGYAIQFSKKNQMTGWRMDYELGYTLFTPRDSVFEIDPQNNFQSTSYATLSDYLLMHLSVGGRRNFVDAEKLKLYAGLNVAYVFILLTADLDGHTGTSAGGTKFGLTPKAGIQLGLGTNWAFLLEGRYNFTSTFQPWEGGNLLPNKRLGNIDNFFSLGAGIVYYLNNDK